MSQSLVLHPKMFRAHPVLFLICLALAPAAGISLLALLIWWLSCLNTTLTISDESTILRKGILGKSTNEVRHQDVRNILAYTGLQLMIL